MKSKDFLGHEWNIDCMGCAIADQSMSVLGGFIYKSQHFCIHQDPLIPLPGFLVIASLRHIRSISEMDDAEYQEFASLVRVAHQAIKQVTQIEHLTIVQEESSIHFHLWFFPWMEEVIQKYGPPSLTKIREIMAEYKKQAIDEAEWARLQKSIKEIKSNLEGGIDDHK
jgi:diadenosine tetraphosphate (Ap4A) HIT family hydrolase